MINVLKINCGLIPIGTLSQKRIKNRFDESFDFQKFVVSKDHYLNGITSTDQCEYKTNCFHEIVIKTTCEERHGRFCFGAVYL